MPMNPEDRKQFEQSLLEPWDPDEALKGLVLQSQVEGEDETTQANRILREAAPMAAQAVVHIAKYARSDSLRFQAAKYVIERNLGTVNNESSTSPKSETSPLEQLLGAVVKDVEDYANNGGNHNDA